MKIMVIGHARHGKDTVCQILHETYGLTFESSSHFCAELVVRPYLEKKGLFYKSVEECYEDRTNWRADWHDAIWEFNSKDPTRLGRALFAKYNIYCGIRHDTELRALREAKVFDVCFWVDASNRLPFEDANSMKLSASDADYIIDNNLNLSALPDMVKQAYNRALADANS